MAYRNPSPPPDVNSPCEEDKDRISETVLSKSWLLSVMIKTVEDTRYRRPCKQQAPKSSTDQQAAGEMLLLSNRACKTNRIYFWPSILESGVDLAI